MCICTRHYRFSVSFLPVENENLIDFNSMSIKDKIDDSLLKKYNEDFKFLWIINCQWVTDKIRTASKVAFNDGYGDLYVKNNLIFK